MTAEEKIRCLSLFHFETDPALWEKCTSTKSTCPQNLGMFQIMCPIDGHAWRNLAARGNPMMAEEKFRRLSLFHFETDPALWEKCTSAKSTCPQNLGMFPKTDQIHANQVVEPFGAIGLTTVLLEIVTLVAPHAPVFFVFGAARTCCPGSMNASALLLMA